MVDSGSLAGGQGTPKEFKSYSEQVDLLASRGMLIDDELWAQNALRSVSYYRLSGYWYPFRERSLSGQGKSDVFRQGTTLRGVMALYDFDASLRSAVFAALSPIELTMRAHLGHELGKIDPLVHLKPEMMGPDARKQRSPRDPSDIYITWLSRYKRELNQSHEDFVAHHREKYGGELPIWAAVEILGWGQLSHLYRLSPIPVRDNIAQSVGLSAAQLGSWIKSLNVVRNYAAHHARMYNRGYVLRPKLPPVTTHPELAGISLVTDRTFGQLSLIQYLMRRLKVGNPRLLPAVMRSLPQAPHISFSDLGAPDEWQLHPLWNT